MVRDHHVCENCGRYWTTHYTSTICLRCGRREIRHFPKPIAALEHAAHIKERRAHAQRLEDAQTTKETTDPFVDPDTLGCTHLPTSRTGETPRSDNAGTAAAPRDRLPPNEDVVVSGQSGTGSYTISAHGTTDFELVVPHLDQPPLDAPDAPRPPLRLVPSDDGKRSRTDLPGIWLGLFGGYRCGALRVRLLDPRGERPVPRHLPDGNLGASDLRHDRVHDGVRANRRSTQLLRSIWVGALGLRLGGPTRTW